MVKYVTYHEPWLKPKFKHRWAKICQEQDLEVNYQSRNLLVQTHHLLIDETVFIHETTKYFALAMCVTIDLEKCRIVADEVISDYLADPLSDGRKSKIKKMGLPSQIAHWTCDGRMLLDFQKSHLSHMWHI